MRVAVTGATGNVGTSVLDALRADPAIEEIVGIATRRPTTSLPKVRWIAADVTSGDLASAFRDVDAVVHLAWRIQPSHEPGVLRATNVTGSMRVMQAVAQAGVPVLVHASSVGAYSPGPKDRAVDESWATNGIVTSEYSRDKAEVERLLDRFEVEHPDVRTVRIRPGLVLKGDAGSHLHRLFLGRLVPNALVRRIGIPLVPNVPGLVFQAVHSADVGEAFRLAVTKEVRGAFNVAAGPVLNPDVISETLNSKSFPLPAKALRVLVDLTWKARLQPTDPGWVDITLQVPVMDSTLAGEVLGWTPRRSATDALAEVVEGLTSGQGTATPPLAPARVGVKTWAHSFRHRNEGAA